MKHLKASLFLAAALAVTVNSNCFAATADVTESAIPASFKVAVVNVPAVLESSKQVAALKKEEQAKVEELKKWLLKAREDVAKQSSKENQEKLVKKYEADFAAKREALGAVYAKKLQAIDANISGIIEQERKAKGYDLILVKGVVLSGGIDITKDIAKKVK